MTEPNLKLCKKCGGKAEVYCMPGGDYWWDTYSVECTECGSHTRQYDTENDAIRAWNRRNKEMN